MRTKRAAEYNVYPNTSDTVNTCYSIYLFKSLQMITERYAGMLIQLNAIYEQLKSAKAMHLGLLAI